MLGINEFGKYELKIETPYGNMSKYFDTPLILGKLVNVRPIQFQSIHKYSGIEKLKTYQIKSFKNYNDSDTMLALRWRLKVLGYSNMEILGALPDITKLYQGNDDQYPELQKNSQHIQIIVESKLTNPPEPIGIITTYRWNKKSNLIYWSEHFDSKKEKGTDVTFREKVEGRALMVKYLVETFGMKTIIASYVGYYGYPKKALDVLGFQHIGTTPSAIFIDNQWSNIYNYIFQESDKYHPMKCIKKALEKIAA